MAATGLDGSKPDGAIHMASAISFPVNSAALANILAAGALAVAALGLWWNRHDLRIQGERLDRLDFEDQAHLRFGTSWGGLQTVPYEKAGFTEGVLVPIENTGKRAGGVSFATWNIVESDGNIIHKGGPAFLTPRSEWPGQGDTTIPAGTRRLFIFPLPGAARNALDTGGAELRLYVRPVARDEDIRAAIMDEGVLARPWTDRESWESEHYEAWMAELADRDEDGLGPR